MAIKLNILFIYLMGIFYANACPVNIYVEDSLENSLTNISVFVDNKAMGTTNNKGVAALSLTDGIYTIEVVTKEGLKSRQTVTIDCNTNNYFKFILNTTQNDSAKLKEVVIQNKTISKQIEESPFSVEVIDFKKQYDKAGDVGDYLNRASGVKLRTDGNIGSQVQINLGGLQGKAVRIFKDGIPIELFGHGFSLGTIPVNMLDRVEIYKGVMPVYLASDALGGGVNLVTRTSNKKFGEVSYEIASFNTHRATANFYLQNKRNFYGGFNGSFNYSDNNYKVNAPVQNETNEEFKEVKRFHDMTRSNYGEAFIGLKEKSWADDLRLTLIYSDFYKQIQNDAQMRIPYGEAYSKEQNYSGMINYRKKFFDDKLKVNFLTNYSYFNTKFIDTATVRYNWEGKIIAQNLQPGEITSGNNQRLRYNFVSSRLNAEYQISDRNFLEFSEMYYYQQRKGSDPLGAVSVIEGVDVLTVPAHYRKDNMAFAWRSLWIDTKLESIIAGKYYHYNTKGYTTDNYGFAWTSSKDDSQFGYLGALKWAENNYLLKFSYEYATRLPDEFEVFGDARMIKENLDLNPEKSHNVNLNGQYSIIRENSSLTFSASLFYRKAKDGIFLQYDIPFSRYINYEQTEVKGLELETNYSPSRWISTGFNATYQDIRRIGINESIYKYLSDSRVPNIPFLFGNFWINTYFNNLFAKKDQLNLTWNANYTHRFFLVPIPKNQEPPLFGSVKDFQTSLVIPQDGRLGQFSNDVGVYYHFSNQKTTVSAECRNIGDVRLYDNFNVQRPGRSFHLKLVYNFF
ncbi:TonB-dependent receptor plug domain-containing protein [Flavobacterium seoulense]|uniref:TonB-dependent receptor, plug n=1 Tax=Flavobacterium seoulense TaxID=1492738 RepID=A0A066WUI0_9FLAO|nr:TonB-dependent receptor plug domain-containing protein [Flavobacterium seoulense]KDN54624.1 TonB-dependent receptor, plug [Flavobacterium seoulense]